MTDVAVFYQQLANAVNGIIGTFDSPRPEIAGTKSDKSNAGPVAGKNKEEPNKTKVLDKGSKESYSPGISEVISGDLTGLRPMMLEYLKILAKLIAKKGNKETLKITSGYRDPDNQSRVMANNWQSHGGKKPLDGNYIVEANGKKYRHSKPFQIETSNGPQTVSVYGTAYLVDLYSDNDMAYKLGHALETDGNIEGKPWSQWLSEYWQKKLNNNDPGVQGHMMGLGVDLISSNGYQSTLNLVKESEKYASLKTNGEGNHVHVEVQSVFGQPGDAPNVSFIDFPLIRKMAIQISVEPYNSAINDELTNMASKLGADYFTYTDKTGKKIQIDKVVLEDGDPGHFGMVRSDNPSTIYISLNKIRNATTGANGEEALRAAIREVLSHEMGHFKDNMQGGEGPAETEAHRVTNMFGSQAAFVKQLAAELSAQKLHKEAALALKTIGIKTAYLDQHLRPEDVSQSILRIIYHFVQKVKPENQAKYVRSLARKIQQMDLPGLALKKKNPGGGVGQTMALVKNILSGLEPATINGTVKEIFEGLATLVK